MTETLVSGLADYTNCTDQCVVVTCNDDSPACEGCLGNHCELVCEDESNCQECNGFDEFLQCCTDFHSYYEEPSKLPETTWAWDPNLKTFVCGCGGNSTTDVPPNLVGHLLATPVRNTAVTPSHPTSAFSPSLAANAQSHGLACMWGDCGASFASLSDLAEHVNMFHLRPPTAPSLPPSSSSESKDLFSSMACQWKDCTIYPTPESVPGPSSGDIDSMLGFLSSHLLHDHLGLNNNIPSYLPSPPESSYNESLSAEATSPSGSATPSASASNDNQPGHICQWVSCGQIFSSLEDLTTHLTNEHVGAGKAAYDCYWSDCKRHDKQGFTSKQKLCRHLQSHTGHRPFQCKTCLQNFSEAATLQQHMRRHTQEKPYVCDHPGCGKSFAITGALTIHKRTHNGHKPFKCPNCEKAFSESSNLSKHLRTHTGARPYLCVEPGCNKSFARADQLARHTGVHKKAAAANSGG